MNYVKFNVEVRPYKEVKKKEEDEMDALSKKVLRELNGDDDSEDDDNDYLDDPIWLDTYYNVNLIKKWTRVHQGVKTSTLTVLYIDGISEENTEDFIVINQPINEVLEILSKL